MSSQSSMINPPCEDVSSNSRSLLLADFITDRQKFSMVDPHECKSALPEDCNPLSGVFIFGAPGRSAWTFDRTKPLKLIVTGETIFIPAHVEYRTRSRGKGDEIVIGLEPQLFGEAINNAGAGLPPQTLRRVIDYIQANLESKLGLADLAKIAHLSPYYFTKLFKQSTGFTPHQFVIQCRVKLAKTLLLTGEDSIADIAQKVGFANQAHLNLQLKRVLGVTPTMLLKQRNNL